MGSCNKFDITIISASDLRDVGDEKSKMEVYAKVLVGKWKKKKTPTDKHNGRNPSWSFNMSFSINGSKLEQEGVMVIKLYCKQMGSKKDMCIGRVRKSVSQLFNEAERNNMSADHELPLQKGSGTLRFSHRFQDEPRHWWKEFFIGAGKQTGAALVVAGICCFVS